MLVNIHIPVQYTQCLENPGILRSWFCIKKILWRWFNNRGLFHRTVFSSHNLHMNGGRSNKSKTYQHLMFHKIQPHQAIPEYYLPFTPNFADHNIVSPIFAGYFEIVHPTQLNLQVWHLAFKRQINRHVWVILSLKPPSSYGALELPSTSHPLTWNMTQPAFPDF